jgi:electron transport complex protein RnfB
VDCIEMVPRETLTERGAAITLAGPQPHASRNRYRAHQARRVRQREDTQAKLEAKARAKLDALAAEPVDESTQRKREAIAAALERARARRGAD